MNTTNTTALLSLLLLSTAATAATTNRPPTISGVPVSSVEVKKTYRFFAVAKDPDGNSVSFKIANKPAWAWFDAKTGTLGGEPQMTGTYSNIVISATDGKATVSLPAFSITATKAPSSNTAPVLSGSPASSVSAGTTYSFQPAASDANGDKLSFSIANKPSWATFNTASGQLSGTPAASNVGTYAAIATKVSDGSSSTSLPAFNLVVANTANRPPMISGVPATSVAVKTTYRFFASASDPDGTAVTFSIANKPSWAWFDAKSGILGGEPTALGTSSNIVISATDGKSTVSLPAFSITATGSVANDAPRLSGKPAGAVASGGAYMFQPTAVDPNGDVLAFSITSKPSWATFNTATGRLSGAPQAGDVATYAGIVISVSDGKSVATLPTFAIAVTQISSGSATLSWTPPTANTDGSTLVDLAGYRIYYGSTADALDQVVEVSNPGVASYVMESLPSGAHYFAVKAYSSNGTESSNSAVATKNIL